MMAEYGLEEAQLAVEDQIGIEHQEGRQQWHSPSRRAMAAAVCKLYMVRPLISGRKGEWILIGRKHNIAMAVEMSDYLVETTSRLSVRWRKEHLASNSDMIDFRKGCYLRLTERIVQLSLQQEKAAQPQWTASGNPGNLPALYQQEGSLLTEYQQRHWPKTGRQRAARIRMGTASLHGRAAGDTISLSRQVAEGRGGAMLLGKK